MPTDDISPTNNILNKMRERLGFDLHELAGATFAGDIPVPDRLVNRLIAERLAVTASRVSAARVHALEGDTFEAQVKVAGIALLPMLEIVARVERQPQPNDPILVFRWSTRSLGRLSMLGARVLSHFKVLPPGIRLDAERVTVHIPEILAAHGLTELLDYVTDLELHTRAGAFLLRIGLRVPAASPSDI
jgi:hypothetical protein